MTPAMGQLPMKPITIRRFFFIGPKDRATMKEQKTTPNVQRPTSNVELGDRKQERRRPQRIAYRVTGRGNEVKEAQQLPALELNVGRWTLDVGRSRKALFSL